MDAILDQNTEELSRISQLVRRFKRAVFLASEIKSRAIFRVRQNIVPDAKGYSAKLLLIDLNSSGLWGKGSYNAAKSRRYDGLYNQALLFLHRSCNYHKKQPLVAIMTRAQQTISLALLASSVSFPISP